MASLVGQQLKDTYDSLLKTSDNDALGGTYKEITDGAGNGSNLYLGTGGSVGIGVSPSKAFHIKVDIPEFKLEDTNSQNGAGGLISVGNSGSLFLSADPDNVSNTSSSVFLVTDDVIRQEVKDSGDISFRDGSTNEAFYWDASTARLGIGTTSPSVPLEITGSSSTMLGFNRNSGASDVSLRFKTNTGSPDGTFLNAGGPLALFRFFTESTERMRIDSSGNVLVGSTATPASSAGNIVLGNGTAPTGNAVNGVILYAEDVSTSSELKVRDEAGNVTTLSPHNFSLIPDGASEPMAWAYYSERDGKKINVDMLKLARMVESLTGEKLVYEQ